MGGCSLLPWFSVHCVLESFPSEAASAAAGITGEAAGITGEERMAPSAGDGVLTWQSGTWSTARD